MKHAILASAAACALMAGAAAPGLAQVSAEARTDADLISREALFGNPAYSNVQISPDGSMLSWVAPDERVLNVFVAPADDIAAARAVTSDRGRGVRSYGWVPGGDTLVYIQDRGGDENFLLYGVDPETGEETDLTPFENTRVQILASDEDHPGVMIIGLNNRDARWHDAYRLDVATGDLELIYENTDEIGGYVFDNDLNLRFGQRSTSEGGATYLRYEDGEWTEFLQVSPEDLYTTGLRGFSEDNSTVYLTDSRERNTGALFAYDLESGEQTLIAEDERADIGGVWSDPETGEPDVYSVTYARTELKPLTEDGEAILAALNAQFDGDVGLASRSDDDQTWVLVEYASDEVSTYWLWDREADSFSELVSTRPDLVGAPLAKMEPVIIEARDGKNLVSYLTLPRGTDADGDGRPEEPVPMVLWVHGGPWARDSYGYDTYAQWFANRGYAVLQVNFRGSTGFGKDFVNAGDLEWGEAMHDDLIDAVNWAVAEGVTAEDSVAIGGGSYGGYATLAGLTFTPQTFACGVDIVGPSNLVTLLDSVPPYWESFRRVLETRVGDPNTEEGMQLLRDRSPLNSVDNIQRPLLIGQGANDPRVKQAESDQIVEAMQARDIPVTYVLFPDEGHGFARPENRLAFNAVAEGFLGECLGGRVEPIGDAFTGSSLTVPAGEGYVGGLEEALEGFTPEERG
ncbi:MAG: prolyl oligopeptidase family serine peptidase [Oceanicaulis sp.]